MPNNELVAYVLEIALTHSKDAFPSGDHSVRLRWHAGPSMICISVDPISSIEYRFATSTERMDMQDFMKAKIDSFMEGLREGSLSFELELEFPCDFPDSKKAEGPSTSKGPR